MKRITSADQLTDELVDKEIIDLLRRAQGHVADKKAKLVLGSAFRASDEELLKGPMGESLQRVFDFARGRSSEDRMAVAEACEELLEFLWESEFGQSYQIPDSFWESPLGFAIYEVIGRVPESPDVTELTSAQAAKFLGITQPSLERLTNEGKIPCSREAGGHVRYRVSDLQQARETLLG